MNITTAAFLVPCAISDVSCLEMETARDIAGISANREEPSFCCPVCSYDLRATTSERCPECGLHFGSSLKDAPLVPFAYRKQLGFWQAYWKTVGQVIFRRTQFAASIKHPISRSDARLFWQITSLLAAIPAAAVLIPVFATIHVGPESMKAPPPTGPHDVLSALVVAVCCWVFFYMLTTLPSYFAFRSRTVAVEGQDRAIALNLYAAAPFAWTFVPGGLFVLLNLLSSAKWVDNGFGRTLFWSALMVGSALLTAQAIAWIAALGEIIEAVNLMPKHLVFTRTLYFAAASFFAALFFGFGAIMMVYLRLTDWMS